MQAFHRTCKLEGQKPDVRWEKMYTNQIAWARREGNKRWSKTNLHRSIESKLANWKKSARQMLLVHTS
jgi:hypothetical protein